MRRTILILWVIVSAMMAGAQTLTTTDAVLVYYMPKTLLAFEVEYVETTRTQGPFYQYAERYLGTKEIVMADEKTYELKDVKLHTKTVADPERAYKLNLSATQRGSIVLNKDGVLAAYNAEADKNNEHATSGKTGTNATDQGHKAKKKLAPLSEEALFASSKAKMAEAAAKQIYRIREARMSILSCEVEHMPTDSKMLSTMLHELEEQEEELVALFVGTSKRKTQRQIVYYTPAETEQDKVLLRFSRYAGIVGADDLSGEPLKLTLIAHKQELLPSEEQKPEPVSDIVYNLPGEAQVILCDSKGNNLIDKTIPVAQFGVSIALPQALMKRKPHILFNTRTGAITSISE